MELAMAATAYARSRGTHTRQHLFSAVHALLAKVPFSGRVLDKSDMADAVRAALACGRSAGLSWQDMRIIFNEENEKAPAPLSVAMAEFEKSVLQKRNIQ